MQKNAIHSQQVYDPTDESIMAEQELCMERLYAYNHTRPSEHAKRAQLLKEMLAECGAGCWIEPPFHANWGGKHVHMGDYVYANSGTAKRTLPGHVPMGCSPKSGVA